jgi:hypothetical protein
VVNEIVRDVVEMAAYPDRTPLPPVIQARADGLYRWVLDSVPVELDLHDDVWAPARFLGIARAAFGSRVQERASTADLFPRVHPALLDFTPARIVDVGELASRALAVDMRNGRAHEAAALTLGTFALREAAGRFGDTRWALNRMTAHLAIAGALSPDLGIDGQLAEAVFLVLTNRQVRASDAIDRVQRNDPAEPVAAWARALHLRMTQDWRSAHAPQSATRLEQEEYVRARRATVSGSLAIVELQRVGASPDAAWIRLVENSSMGVQDGWLGAEALDFEQAEYRDVYQRIHGVAAGPGEIDALNKRAGRCLMPDGPRVLPWSAWAEFAQRHLAMFIDRHDRFYRKLQGNARMADSEKERVTRVLGQLTMFPVATVFWTKGPRGAEADLRYQKEAIATILHSPERITPAEWAFVESSIHYEPVAGGMPRPAEWFLGASPRVTQNAGARLRDTGHSQSPDVTAAILKEAPYDYEVANDYLTMKYGVKTPYAEVRAVLGRRLEYDTRALSTALQFAPSGDERLALLRTSCDVSPRNCMSLGWELAAAKREPEAAAAYERAFDDPTVDAVAAANGSGWLVTYYLRHKRIDDALALAERGAATQSWQGLVTLAYLAERLSRFAEAEAGYREAATHYQNLSQLLGFYYRDVVVRKRTRYDGAWTAALARVFPQGLVQVPSTTGRPMHAIAINSDTTVSRQAGLFIGDLIVGLEGYRVETLDQYRAVNAFFEQGEMKLTVWRGDKLLPITVTVPTRNMGVELRSYPIEGYREK